MNAMKSTAVAHICLVSEENLYVGKWWSTKSRTWGVASGDGATAVLNKAGSEFGHAAHVAAMSRKLVHLHLHWTWGPKVIVTVYAHQGLISDRINHWTTTCLVWLAPWLKQSLYRNDLLSVPPLFCSGTGQQTGPAALGWLPTALPHSQLINHMHKIYHNNIINSFRGVAIRRLPTYILKSCPPVMPMW